MIESIKSLLIHRRATGRYVRPAFVPVDVYQSPLYTDQNGIIKLEN